MPAALSWPALLKKKGNLMEPGPYHGSDVSFTKESRRTAGRKRYNNWLLSFTTPMPARTHIGFHQH